MCTGGMNAARCALHIEAVSLVKLVDEALHRSSAFALQVDRLAAGVFVVHHDIDLVRLLSLRVVFHDLELLFALKPSDFCLTGALFQFSCSRIAHFLAIVNITYLDKVWYFYYYLFIESGGGTVGMLQIAPSRKTMTLNLTEAEMKALDELSATKDISKTAVLRQALRLYQMIEARIARGEKLFFEHDITKEKAELMLL